MTQNLTQKHEQIVQWLKLAKEKIESYQEVSVETKADDKDLVTIVDKEIEALLTDRILSAYPDSTILGEETYTPGAVDVNAEQLWVIDPIDGTNNFVKQRNDFVILIAYFEKGEPLLSYVYDISRDIIYHAIKGRGVFGNNTKLAIPANSSLEESFIAINAQQMKGKPLLDVVIDAAFDVRYIGSAGLDGMKVAMGGYGAFICPKLGPWDFAPFILIAHELGLVMSQLDGSSITLTEFSSFIMATPSIHQHLIGE